MLMQKFRNKAWLLSRSLMARTVGGYPCLCISPLEQVCVGSRHHPPVGCLCSTSALVFVTTLLGKADTAQRNRTYEQCIIQDSAVWSFWLHHILPGLFLLFLAVCFKIGAINYVIYHLNVIHKTFDSVSSGIAYLIMYLEATFAAR